MRKKEVFKRGALSYLRESLAAVLFPLAIVVMIVFGLYRLESSNSAEGLRVLEESLLRAAVKCYAAEGRYPESIAYIEDNYGVFIDRTRYSVHYEIFADNLLPEITVIKLKK